ncbi:MAG: hypothetical protein PHC54_02810 [Candidatus Omnitrophica bacterium]|nr:hypothetical protein [Candidatus Omnitrophota bacterium]
MARVGGLFTFIPATLLLTLSFFVLYALRKTDTQGLKSFGYIIAALLWLSALLVFSAGIYTLATGRRPMKCMMQEMMQHKMQGIAEEGKTPGMMHKGIGESMMKR